MSFVFYPNHEHKCPNVSHCPHLGGAALGTLVLMANEQELSRRALHAIVNKPAVGKIRIAEKSGQSVAGGKSPIHFLPTRSLTGIR